MLSYPTNFPDVLLDENSAEFASNKIMSNLSEGLIKTRQRHYQASALHRLSIIIEDSKIYDFEKWILNTGAQAFNLDLNDALGVVVVNLIGGFSASKISSQYWKVNFIVQEADIKFNSLSVYNIDIIQIPALEGAANRLDKFINVDKGGKYNWNINAAPLLPIERAGNLLDWYIDTEKGGIYRW